MTTRVLGAVRLSRSTDESTSPARQREIVEQWATMHSAEVVETVEDLDVSGAVSPWDRPGLGPWLTEADKVTRWDTLVVWKLDRLSRSASDTLRLLEWAREHDKRIVAVSDSLDSGSQMGRVWLQLAAIFAEVERTNIGERILASRRYLRSVGRWAGGHAPYGYRPVETEDGYRLEHDPEEAPIVRELVERVLAGEAPHALARDLTRRAVPPPRSRDRRVRWRESDGAWSASSVRSILRSPALRGWARYRGRPVLGPDGLPQQVGPELVDAGEWELLQDTLDARSRKIRPRDKARSPLYGVVFCACGSHMIGSRTKHGERRYSCARTHKAEGCPVGGSVLAAPVEEFAEERFLTMFGGMRVIEYNTVAGVDHTAEIRELKASLARLDEAYRAGAFEGDVSTYAEMRRGIRSKMAQLEAAPVVAPHVEEKDLGVTYGMMWELTTDVEERRQLMLGCHFVVEVGARVGRGRTTRAQIRERLSAGISEDALAEPEDYT